MNCQKGKTMKQVQISEELFSRICMFFLLDRTEPEQVDAITAGLQDKLARMRLRETYIEQLRKK